MLWIALIVHTSPCGGCSEGTQSNEMSQPRALVLFKLLIFLSFFIDDQGKADKTQGKMTQQRCVLLSHN